MKGTPLKVEMVKQGITQTQLVEQTGLSRCMVNLLANGKTRPGLNTALKIAGIMGVSVEYLWGANTTNSNPTLGRQTNLRRSSQCQTGNR